MRWTAIAAFALVLVSCASRTGPKRDPAIATAFTGPVSLNLRAEVNPQSKPIATAQHGDKLEVLQIRRRFVRVRTPKGEEGWTEVRNLLGPEQMDAIEQLAKHTARLPSQGEATVYASLNIHSEPNRTATSFYKITEGMKVDVVGHQLVPRSATPPPAQGFQLPKPPPRPKKQKERKEVKVPPPPRPAPPALPSNWRELSKTDLPAPIPDALIAQKKKDEPKVVVEDWSLVRTKDAKAGWVLTRNLVMAIPDEVAQYSEGARITSYFALGDVQDGDQMKHHWLWTTMRDTGEAFDFDSFRVFIYVLRKHRYETAYIERRVEGFYPVTVVRGTNTRFGLILRNENGDLIRRTYQLEGYIVRKIAEQPFEMKSGTPGATIAGDVQKEAGPEDTEPDEQQPKPGILDRLKSWFRK